MAAGGRRVQQSGGTVSEGENLSADSLPGMSPIVKQLHLIWAGCLFVGCRDGAVAPILEL